jgi:tetratricopeptide (TPR) repeat protein
MFVLGSSSPYSSTQFFRIRMVQLHVYKSKTIKNMQVGQRVFGFHLVLAYLMIVILPSSMFGQDSLTPIIQNETAADSIRIKAINQYYKSQTYAKPEDVLKLTFLHEKLASKTNNQQEIAHAFNERSYAYFVMGDVKNSMQALKQGIAVFESLNDEVNLVTFYANLANLLSAEGQYKDAINYYHKSLDMFRRTGKWENEALTLNNIGIQLINLEGYDLALNHFEEALAIFKSKNKMEGSGFILAGMSLVYLNQGKLDLAINTAKESVILLEKDNNQVTKADACFVLAKAYQKKADKNKARFYLDESLQISRDLKNDPSLFDRLIFDAKLSLDDDINLATKKAENLLSHLTEEISPNIKSELYELLYNCYKGQDKYDKSLEMYEKHKMYSDSAATQKEKLDIMRQVIQKGYDDELLKKDTESKEVQSKLKAKHRNKLIGILISSFLFIGALHYYSRTKIAHEKRKGEEFLSELHILKKQVGKIKGMDRTGGLNKEKLEKAIEKKINETDWNVLNILYEDPVISNKELADKAYLSVDGIGSSLRRMYEYFDIPNSKYMKIVLLLKAIKLSNHENLQG